MAKAPKPGIIFGKKMTQAKTAQKAKPAVKKGFAPTKLSQLGKMGSKARKG